MSEEVILEKLDNIHKVMDVRLGNIETHLKNLNGQVAKNTKFRYQQTVINGILGVIGVSAIGLSFKKVFGL